MSCAVLYSFMSKTNDTTECVPRSVYVCLSIACSLQKRDRRKDMIKMNATIVGTGVSSLAHSRHGRIVPPAQHSKAMTANTRSVPVGMAWSVGVIRSIPKTI